MSHKGRKAAHVDAEGFGGEGPFHVVVGVEDEVGVGGDGDPAIGFDLGFQLPRRPAGVTDG